MKFSYSLTDEAKTKIFVETGKRPGIVSTLEIDDESATPEQRQKFIELTAAYGTSTIGNMAKIGNPVIQRFTFDISFDKVSEPPTAETVWSMVDDMLEKAPIIKQQAESQKAEQTRILAEQKKARMEIELKREQERAERIAREKAELIAEIEKASNIVWDENDKAVINLLDTLFIIAGDEQDDRFKNWAKEVVAVESINDNGYSFVGEFVNDGTVEIERKARVYLVASTSGSRKYASTTYRVIVMDETGKLNRTDITTDNRTPGWALRIRDQVKALLS